MSGKIFTVARYEFLRTIERKEFLFMTFIFPIFMAGIILVPALLMGTTSAEDQKIGYIDMTKSFDFPASSTSKGLSVGPVGATASTIYFVKYESISEARNALQAEEIYSYLVIPENFLKIGVIKLYASGKGVPVPTTELMAELSYVVINSLLKDKVDEPVLNTAIPVLNKNTCGRRLNFLIFRNNFISLSTCIEYES
jgi:ABC-2 type transport system permease protein